MLRCKAPRTSEGKEVVKFERIAQKGIIVKRNDFFDFPKSGRGKEKGEGVSSQVL